MFLRCYVEHKIKLELGTFCRIAIHVYLLNSMHLYAYFRLSWPVLVYVF
jgi:hypothetical protein